MRPLSWCLRLPCLTFLNTVAMHRVSPRRSACDRCRAHKLRCVRLDQNPNTNPNSNSNVGNTDVLMPCQRCLKAGTPCHATNLSAKPMGENHPVRHVSTSSGHSSSPYQQWPPVGDRQLKDFSIDMSAQSAPQAQRRKSNGPAKDASPPWQQIFAPPSSRSHLGSPKGPHLLNNDSRPDRRLPEAPASLVTPPASEKAHRTGHTPSLDMDKVGIESREFYPVSNLLQDSTRNPAHMLDYPPREPLVSSNYFDTAANVMVGQNLREQKMHLSTDECLHRLSQLSSKLLMDFGKANNSDMGNMMSFLSPTTGTPTWHQDGANGVTTSYLSSSVSKLFESLQIFLETVERLRPCPDSSSASECSYSDQWDESELVSTTDGSQIYPNTIIVDHTNGSSDPHQNVVENAGARPSDTPRQFDMPATLTMLTCYTWLLKGYEMVLSGIQEALASQYRLQGLKSLPTIFNGPGIGSFALEDHPDMQIEIVIHIGSQLLHRIEGVLGINIVSERPNGQDSQVDRREVLDTNSAAALLDIWFAKGNHGENNSGDPCGGRRVQIKQTIENIRRLLREYWRDFQGN
ncbi:hypothetical protein F4679DRAFT_527771 [Xylaria curta]|nr:hypothetical protein F4679DRAFT_527771 [Xylaria curta]